MIPFSLLGDVHLVPQNHWRFVVISLLLAKRQVVMEIEERRVGKECRL